MGDPIVLGCIYDPLESLDVEYLRARLRSTAASSPYLYFPRLYFLSDPGRSIALKEENMNPQHQDEARER